MFFHLNGPGLVKWWRAKKRAKLGVSEEEREVRFDQGNGGKDCFGVDWESAKSHYAEHGWFFCDPFLTESFGREVKADWPDRMYLNPPKKVTKWYNTGFFWMRTGILPKYLPEHPGVQALLQALGSKHFQDQISNLAGCPMEFTEFHLTDSEHGAEVPMHLDSLLQGENGDKAIGIAIFVDGSGGEHSGGLSVSASKEWADLIFEPKNLRNTALIYSKKLHHGFLPIAKGKFRHSINTQFWPVGAKGS